MKPSIICRAVREVAHLTWVAFVIIVTSQASAVGAALRSSTYLGGSHEDGASGVAVDGAGNAYVVGTTESPDFPITTGADRALTGSEAAFVAKFSPEGALVYSTFIPGICGGVLNAITVDAEGNAYVTGQTGLCWEAGFQTDVVVAKLDPSGSPIYVYSFGGSLGESSEGDAIAIDAEENAYIAGRAPTASSSFPTTPGAFQTNSCGGFMSDGFVAKVNPAGNGLVYCSYLCGTGMDVMNCIAVDLEGNAYVAGGTSSHDFPVVNAFQAEHPGDVFTSAGFLCKVNPTGNKLEYSTYFTGSFGDTMINAIALDAHGNACATGGSTGGKLPTTPGVLQPASPFPSCYGALCSDAFVAKFSPAGALLFSTWLAGEQDDSGGGIVLDAEDNIYVTGSTSSIYFPVLDAFQREKQGVTDAFVTKLNPDASRILFSSYLGGGKLDDSDSSPNAENRASGIALDSSGNVVLAGYTSSFHFPTTPGVFQPETGGGFCFLTLLTCGDAFVTRLTPNGSVPQPAISLNVNPREILPGGTITATWAGIPSPSQNDQIYLLQLGDAGHGPFILASFPTTGAADGAVTIAMPATLAPGTYELRLYTLDPAHAPLLQPVARSEPVSVLDPPRVICGREAGNLVHVIVSGLLPGSYQVDATERIEAPDWQALGRFTASSTGTIDFKESINFTSRHRFYRVSK